MQTPTPAMPPPSSTGCCAEVLDAPLFRALFDNAPLAQAVASTEGIVQRINPSFTALLGYAAQDIVGKPVLAITHPDDVPKSWWTVRKVGASLPRLTYQKRYVHKNGRTVPALVTLSALELGKCRAVLGQIVDLTALNQAHERLQTALEGAAAGAWEIDLGTGHLEWDEALRRRFGVAQDEPTPSLDGWLAHVHADDRTSVLAALRHATLPGHGRFDHEFRMHCPDDVQRWFRCVGRVSRDEPGRGPRAIGIAIDVTRAKEAQLERERIQAALLRTELRLAAIVANSRDAIIGTSPDLRIITWNAAAEALLGYAEREAVGMHVADLLAQERRPFIASRAAALQAGVALPPVASACLRKDGQRVPVEISISPVPGDDGRPAWYSAIVRPLAGHGPREAGPQEPATVPAR